MQLSRCNHTRLVQNRNIIGLQLGWTTAKKALLCLPTLGIQHLNFDHSVISREIFPKTYELQQFFQINKRYISEIRMTFPEQLPNLITQIPKALLFFRNEFAIPHESFLLMFFKTTKQPRARSSTLKSLNSLLNFAKL